MFKIPLTFDYSEDDSPDIEWRFIESKNCWEICFTLLNLSFYYDKKLSLDAADDYYLDINKIEKLNPHFKAHGRCGYSLGCFHEFFLLSEESPHVSFRIENAEISLGEATPLSRYIFDGEHKGKYHGDWEYIQTIRLLNVPPDKLEIYLLNALNHIQVCTGFKDHLKSISWKDYVFWLEQSDESEEDDELETDNESIIEDQIKVYKDIEAVSLYRYALTAEDNLSACIYYYRIIEFYAFLRKHHEIDKIRQDQSLNSKNFSKKIHNLVKANESENICGLLEEVVTIPILDFAFNNQLTPSNTKKAFANALYGFRNRIVHAKYEHTSSLIVDSILNPSSELAMWREVFSKLVPEILDKFGI
jgi:hypothetical protein